MFDEHGWIDGQVIPRSKLSTFNAINWITVVYMLEGANKHLGNTDKKYL